MPRVILSCDPSIEWMGGRFVARIKVGRWFETDPVSKRKTRDKSRPFDKYRDALRWLARWGGPSMYPEHLYCWRHEDSTGKPYTVCLGREGQRVVLRVVSDFEATYDGVYAVAYPGGDLELVEKASTPAVFRRVLEVFDNSDHLVQTLKKEIQCRESHDWAMA